MGLLKNNILGNQNNKVLMADNTLKPIDLLSIGDEVKDAFGNVQIVDGINVTHLSADVPLLKINNSLVIVDGHPLFSSDEKFHCYRSQNKFDTIKPNHKKYIVGNNIMRDKWTWSDKSFMRMLNIGDQIKTVSGYETISSIEEVSHPEDFDDRTIYRHSVTGSGTYFVDGFCIAARINETWDYENSTPINGVVTIINNTSNNTFERKINLDLSTNTYPYWSNERSTWLYP